MANISIYFWGTYLVLSVIFGLIGKNTKLGFWGVFLISVFLTPAIGMIVVLTAKPKTQNPRKR